MISADLETVVIVRYSTNPSTVLGYTKSHHHIFCRVIYYKCFIISPSKGTDPFVSPVSWLPQFGSCSLFVHCSFTSLLVPIFSFPFPPPNLIPHEDLCHHLFPLFLLSPSITVFFPPPPPGYFPVHPASGVALWPNLWSRCCVWCFCVKRRKVLPFFCGNDITPNLPTCLCCTWVQATSHELKVWMKWTPVDTPADF